MAGDDRVVVVNFIPSVAVGIAVVVGVRRAAYGFQIPFGIRIGQRGLGVGIPHRLVHHPRIVVGVQQFRRHRRVLESGVPVVGERRTRFRTALGRDEDDAVGASHAIGSHRCGVLQHRDRLDDVGVEHAQVTALHTVHDNQRTAVAEGRDTADVDFGLVHADFAGALGRDESGHLPDQRRTDVGDGFRIDLVVLDHPHRRRQRRFLLGTVTDDDLLDLVGVGLHGHVDARAAADRHLLGLHAHEREDQHGVLREVAEGVFTLFVGHGPRSGAFHDDRGTDQRSRRIGHPARHGEGRGLLSALFGDHDVLALDLIGQVGVAQGLVEHARHRFVPHGEVDAHARQDRIVVGDAFVGLGFYLPENFGQRGVFQVEGDFIASSGLGADARGKG